MPTIISLTSENIDNEHICCAIAEAKGEGSVASKKTWLKERFQDGLRFKKINIRGKAFIEYIPADKAWVPIEASGFMHINCFWVSGQYKGKGFSNLLLAECIRDAQAAGFSGLTVISSTGKKPFLSDGSHLKYKGFILADKALPFYELLYLPLKEKFELPHFKSCATNASTNERGIVLYFTNQCPFAEKSANTFKCSAEQHRIPITLHKLISAEQAQNSPVPFTTYSLFYNGSFVSNEILSEKKIHTFLNNLGK